MLDYLAAVRRESARFLDLVRATPLQRDVPSCPGWSVADLAWHLTEVQHFWASIVGRLLVDPNSVERVGRPSDDDLPGLFEVTASRLVDALESGNPEDECWSWHDAGHSIGWVLRRQAHEALIHRVDAELSTDGPFNVDPDLAADGVDEVLRVMLDLDNLPDWATYEVDGSTAVIETDDGAGAWAMNLGRFKGTSPASGKEHDFPALKLVDDVAEPSLVLRGTGTDLDLWLWGRGPLDPISVEGDRDVAARLRAAAADGTQ